MSSLREVMHRAEPEATFTFLAELHFFYSYEDGATHWSGDSAY